MDTNLKPKTILAACAAGLVLFLSPQAASAATRYASPGGPGSAPCTDSGSPCSLATALGQAAGGDDVSLIGGVPPDAPFNVNQTLNVPSNVTVHGTPGTLPEIFFSAAAGGDGLFLNPGSTLRDVWIEMPVQADGFFALGATVERVLSHATGNSYGACSAGKAAVIRDSLCVHTGYNLQSYAAVGVYSQTASDTVTLRNVTAFSTNSDAIYVQSQSGSGVIKVTATNVIARGGPSAHDVRTYNGGVAQTVALDHSNYGTVSAASMGDVTDSGANQTTPPVFADAANGDFREAPTSLGTLDRGTATGVQGGELDLFGQPRIQGTAPDIGAFESALPASPATASGTTPTTAPPKKKCKKRKHRAAAAKKKCRKKR